MSPDDLFSIFVLELALLLELNVLSYSLCTLKNSQITHSFIYYLISHSASGTMLVTWDSIIHKNTHGCFPLGAYSPMGETYISHRIMKINVKLQFCLIIREKFVVD